MNTQCWINGQPGTVISADDRGLQYGDGVFETMSVRHGCVTLLDQHLKRLAEGCDRLRISLPPLTTLRNELKRAADGQQQAILKLIVTRGSGGRGYGSPRNMNPTRILTRHAWPAYPETWWQEGIRVRMCRTILSSNPQLAGLKHLNRLEQVLARNEWGDTDDIQEGLMATADGLLIEGTMTNIFARLADGTWITPALHACGVAGVMRGYILECAGQNGIAIQVSNLTLDSLYSAAELFVCNSVIGIWPVRQTDARTYPVGEATREIQQWINEI